MFLNLQWQTTEKRPIYHSIPRAEQMSTILQYTLVISTGVKKVENRGRLRISVQIPNDRAVINASFKRSMVGKTFRRIVVAAPICSRFARCLGGECFPWKLVCLDSSCIECSTCTLARKGGPRFLQSIRYTGDKRRIRNGCGMGGL
eukprot:COSAG02_NODE_10372_length_1956_cov_2.769830_1_plen_146_part_00